MPGALTDGPRRFLRIAGVLGVLPEFTRILQVRSFFGVYRVEDPAGQVRLLMHGTTVHGAERLRKEDGTAITGRPCATDMRIVLGDARLTLTKYPTATTSSWTRALPMRFPRTC
jgi:hypothetical protein